MQSWAIATLNFEPHFFKSPLNALAADLRFETKIGLHPWNSPGSAKIVGNGCGVNGGNPGKQ